MDPEKDLNEKGVIREPKGKCRRLSDVNEYRPKGKLSPGSEPHLKTNDFDNRENSKANIFVYLTFWRNWEGLSGSSP